MCGIAGIISAGQNNNTGQRLQQMTHALAHRGPDGEGHWLKGAAALGHRRLAIIDISPAGAQPMHYANRYSIVHNGEIYNYLELRATLQKKGYTFTSQSDTEVILAAYDCWQQDCLQQLDGMFAFAIWDEQTQTLFAARDRFGEKPFYYCLEQTTQSLLFASEIKALWAAGIPKERNDTMLLHFLTLGFVQHPADKATTFFKHIYSLPPAHYMRYRSGDGQPVVQAYWTLQKKEQPLHGQPEAVIAQFFDLLQQSVRLRLRSDVPVGTSLSGGIDSAAIAALMSRETPNIQSFSAVFPGFEKDESINIELTSGFLHISNQQTQPNATGLLADFEKLCWHQEQPFSSASIFAQYKVFELAAAQGVTVLLDGQGADETLAGYPRYIHWYLQQLWRQNKAAFAEEKQALLQNNIPFRWGMANRLASYFPGWAASRLTQRAMNAQRHQPDVAKDFFEHSYQPHSWQKPILKDLNDVLYYDTVQMGLEELLRYADRNSMAHGREVRLPFLSHHLVEWLFALPAQYKIHKGFAKWILRKAINDWLPPPVSWQTKKTGFEPPQQQWMQNAQVQQLVQAAKEKLVGAGILQANALQKKMEPKAAHDADNFDWRYLCAAHTLL